MRAVVGAEVLVIDRDARTRDGIDELATEAKMAVTGVVDPSDAWELLRERFFSVALVDLDTPHLNAGLDTVTTIQMVSPSTSILILTPRKSYQLAVDAIRAGALDVIHKSPGSVEYLERRMIVVAAQALRRRAVGNTLREASTRHDSFLHLLMTAERELVDAQDRLAAKEPEHVIPKLRILVVDRHEIFAKELKGLAPKGFAVEHALTGGEALDRGSSTPFHFALVSQDLPDLPQSMVVRSLKSQSGELVALTFTGPGKGGSVEIADNDGGAGTAVLSSFAATKELVERLPDLAEAFQAKEKQRRYTRAFRDKHLDFVKKFVSFKEQLAALQGDLGS